MARIWRWRAGRVEEEVEEVEEEEVVVVVEEVVVEEAFNHSGGHEHTTLGERTHPTPRDTRKRHAPPQKST